MSFGEKGKGSSIEDTNKGKTKEMQNIQAKTKQELDTLKKTLNIVIKDNPYFSDPYYQKASKQIGNWPYGPTPDNAIKAYAEKMRSKDESKAKGYVDVNDLWTIAFVGNEIFKGLPVKLYNTFVDFYHKRTNEKMTKEEIDFKENIAQNIFPWGYDIFPKMMSFVNNEKKYTKETIGKLTLPMQIREDMFRKYLWLDQYSNFIVESTSKPTQSKEKTIYYDFNETLKKKIILDTKKELNTDSSFQGLINHILDDTSMPLSWVYTKKIENFMDGIPSHIVSQLARHKVWIAYDPIKKERYVSYYDLRDLDPQMLKNNWMDLDKYNSPFEIYGRIYENDFNAVQ
ncbi:MAG: hypothetical protein ACD_80C00111G0005 [uncultured bacterium (gcode 4)]|uniref:Uncharacterized protein n=1 Tax=uncultured bacterium (gcode 4) TaxID=1234023 RepID=K1XXX6_9BACT|nr:MAG: hypothetical protein ACD_80C00111G0005 [uncultured bacterium (gcode 4)]